MEETIELKEYFKIIKKNIKVIGIITIATAIITGSIAFLFKPKTNEIEAIDREYEASSKIAISYDTNNIINKVSGISDKEYIKDEIEKVLNYNSSLLKTYSEIAKSNLIIENVIDRLNLNVSVSELIKNITIQPIENSQIINISVIDKNPKVATDIANEIPKAFKDNQKNLDIIVVDKAVVPEEPVPLLDEKGNPLPEDEQNKEQSPSRVKKVVMNSAIGVVLGGMISLFVVFLKEYMDGKVRSIEQVEKVVGLDILGVIPKENI